MQFLEKQVLKKTGELMQCSAKYQKPNYKREIPKEKEEIPA